MGSMRVKKVFVDEDNKKIMEINVLPGKYCVFNCVFCPIKEKGIQSEATFSFEETEEFLRELSSAIDKENPEVLFINSMGESFAQDRLEEILDVAASKHLEVSLYTNGYLLGEEAFARIARKCHEVSGEIKAVTEESFQKLQRPLEGYSLGDYVDRMARFREGYAGRFTVYVTLMKGINDDDASLEEIRRILSRLRPDRVVLETFSDDRFGKVWGVSEEAMREIRRRIHPER